MYITEPQFKNRTDLRKSLKAGGVIKVHAPRIIDTIIDPINGTCNVLGDGNKPVAVRIANGVVVAVL